MRACRPRMQRSAADGNQRRFRRIYGMAGRAVPALRDGDPSRGQGDGNRTTYWCPACQT